MEKKSQISFTLPEELKTEFLGICKKKMMNKSVVIESLIGGWVQALKDIKNRKNK